MNPIIVLEIIISILAVGYMVSLDVPIKFDTRYYLFEDLYASLITLNYQNYSSKKVCNIIENVIPRNYKYVVFENGNIICGESIKDYYWGISHFIEYNNTIYNITILITR
ncbi:MAG TPA: hypothetical protein EYH09_01510 [Candidatus Nanopusillus sp.]|nr:hypothetical protein [Candidatus Nanopusillus sp.]HIP90480.1 hypothetical protein [Candidatus Nanopusillus sp.]